MSVINDSKENYWIQYVITFSVSLLNLSVGLSQGWLSPAIPMLFHADTPLEVSRHDASLIVSLDDIGVFLAALPAAWLMDKFGRKKTLIVGAIPITLSWLLTASAISPIFLFVARLLAGATTGICMVVSPMYLGEIASPSIRGRLIVISIVTNKLGILLSYLLGHVTTFRVLALINVIPPILFIIVGSFLPESSYNLLKMDMDIPRGTYRDLYTTRGSQRALLITVALATVEAFSGGPVIVGYSETIFRNIGTHLPASFITILLGIILVLAGILSASVVDLVGRRPLLLVSIIGTIICSSTVASFFMLQHFTMSLNALTWIPIGAIMLFIICYIIGMATVNFAIVSEIWPPNLKAMAGAIYTLFGSLSTFIMFYTFQFVSDELGNFVPFFGYAATCALYLPIVWYFIPETKGKPLEEITRDLNK